jgi:hypothetical protein
MRSKIKAKLTGRVRLCIWIMIAGLAISGITAFPIETELGILVRSSPVNNGVLQTWLDNVYGAVRYVNITYPYLSYGTDWLAFAHLLLAVLFIGPLKNPLKNTWVIEFGLIAAISIFPLAFIAGEVRGIHVFWRLIDCSFGLVALVVLLPAYRMIRKLERINGTFCK